MVVVLITYRWLILVEECRNVFHEEGVATLVVGAMVAHTAAIVMQKNGCTALVSLGSNHGFINRIFC
jgi:hypothetical protein